MVLPILALGGVSLVISLAATFLMIHLAPRIGLVDRPGHRKIHAAPKPLGGGVAIVLAFVVPLMAAWVVIGLADTPARQQSIWQFPFQDRDTLPEYRELRIGPFSAPRAYVDGFYQQVPTALGLVAAVLVLHILGLIDDGYTLGPFVKLFIQLAVAALFVTIYDIRAVTLLDQLGFGRWPSVIITILWIVGITNAFNFLDNMDGLSAGVGAVCTTAFLITAILIEQWFVAATLALLLGALLGFLVFNFPPAKIFMGDSGSLVIGFLLGVLTVRTTYLPPGTELGAGWYAVFAPVIVLAVPLYDLIVVSLIRISRGKSPFVGDTNHFSHRLVARGMSRRTAVLCIYLVTAATAVAAILLPHVQTTFAAMLIFGQTLLILGVVALLEQHPLPLASRNSTDEGGR